MYVQKRLNFVFFNLANWILAANKVSYNSKLNDDW